MFDFTPTSEFELAVHGMLFFSMRMYRQMVWNTADGMNVRILETDDGSGWVKVADQDGNSGLVPASYIQAEQGGSADTNSRERGTLSPHNFLVVGAACSPLPLVRAIYSYLAQGPDELSLQEGDIIELLNGPTAEDGWWEGNCCLNIDLNASWISTIGSNSRGQRGIFPNNYVTNHSFICMNYPLTSPIGWDFTIIFSELRRN